MIWGIESVFYFLPLKRKGGCCQVTSLSYSTRSRCTEQAHSGANGVLSDGVNCVLPLFECLDQTLERPLIVALHILKSPHDPCTTLSALSLDTFSLSSSTS